VAPPAGVATTIVMGLLGKSDSALTKVTKRKAKNKRESFFMNASIKIVVFN
jgi:hypothetical protein